MLQRHEREQKSTMTVDHGTNHELEIALDLVLDAFSSTAFHDEATDSALQMAGQLYSGEQSAQIKEIIKQLGETMQRDARTTIRKRSWIAV